ncbi:hypothetical protein [Streptomyces eurythermus]|uniref:hypothetical protein n=1 Tax=Streptomyces eurythermus TaxID=42237 RepID=UPI0036FA5176
MIVVLSAMFAGLAVGVLMAAVVGVPLTAAMGAGGGTLAFTYGAGMSAFSYIRRQSN